MIEVRRLKVGENSASKALGPNTQFRGDQGMFYARYKLFVLKTYIKYVR